MWVVDHGFTRRNADENGVTVSKRIKTDKNKAWRGRGFARMI
jgi:hypothetical protein